MKIKDIALSAAYVGQRVVKAIAVGAHEVWSAVKYILFADPVVAQICATNFGDGSGLTEEQAASVTSIGSVFKANAEITSFDELAEFTGVESLSDSAFEGCSNMSRIKIPTNVSSAGNSVFKDCKSLVKLDFSESNLDKFGQYFCKGCANLTTVEFPNKPIRIEGLDVFHSCPNLVNINLTNVIFISQSAFSYSKLPKSIRLENAQYVGPFAFSYTEIEEVYIGGSVSTIYNQINNISTLKTVEFGNNIKSFTITGVPALTTIENAVDNRRLDLISVSGNNLLNIEDLRFPNIRDIIKLDYCKCKSASDLGLSPLREGSFYGCEGLEFVVIPYICTALANTFGRCSSLKTVVMNPIVPPSLSGSTITNNMSVYVPNESLDDYKGASNWGSYSSVIHPITDYITYEDVSELLVSDVIYNTPINAWSEFDFNPISSQGSKSLIVDVANYNYAKIKGYGGSNVRLYCFIDEENKVVTTALESVIADPAVYIVIPKIAAKMIVNLDASSTEFEVKIGNHIE